jgi:putative PIN family toxin of toxin-antitoxin system
VLAVFDPNILVSALITPTGLARRVIEAGTQHRFDYVVCPWLVNEFDSVAGRPKVARVAPPPKVHQFRADFLIAARSVPDPAVRAISRDPKDDYLVALAEATHADHLVSGDHDLLELTIETVTITSLRRFAELLGLT